MSSPNKNPVFVPSPRWLSESPAYPGTLTHVEPTPPSSSQRSQRSFNRSQELRSPVPPPPANLYQGNADTFNVDPGIPFLATAGPTDAGSSDGGSIKEESPRDKRFVGGFVTGIKRAVRNSLRDRTRGQPPLPLYAQPSQFRDSGYAASTSQFNPPPPILPPQVYDGYPPPNDSPTRPPSETLLGHQPHQHKLYDQTAIVGNQEILEVLDSPVSVSMSRASSFAAIEPSPTPSYTTLGSYIRRASNLVHDISTLPWVAKDRVTADYYPEHPKRSDEPKRRPAMAWTSQNYRAYEDFENDAWGLHFDGNAAPSEMSSPVENLMAPRRMTTYEGVDLGYEFGDRDDRAEGPAYYSPHPERVQANGNAQPIAQEQSIWPDRGQHTPRPYPQNETWADPTSQVQHPPVGLQQSVGTDTIPTTTTRQQPPSQPQQSHLPNQQPASHRTAQSTSSRTRRQALLPSIPPQPRPRPPPAQPSAGGSWQEYPREMGGYVPYEFAEHYYGDKYGPGVHAARPPLPGAAAAAAAPPPPPRSTASSRRRQPKKQPQGNPIPVLSPRVDS